MFSSQLDKRNASLGRVRVEFINESENQLSNVRLSVGSVYGRPAEVIVSSGFLSAPELQKIRASIVESERDGEFFAEIPSLPPESQLTIDFFGEVYGSSKPNVSLVGGTVTIVPVVLAEKSGLVGFLLEPSNSALYPIIAVGVFVLLAALVLLVMIVFSREAAALEVIKAAKNLVKRGADDEAKNLIEICKTHGLLKASEISSDSELKNL